MAPTSTPIEGRRIGELATAASLGPAAFYIALDEPDAMHARVAGVGAEIVMPLVDQEYGSREFAARDYENNVWCFGTYRAGPK